jgi:hypothetical protein
MRQDLRSQRMLLLQRCLIVAIAYGLLGKLSLMLAEAADMQTPMWLPFGVVLAAWLRWGPSCLIGVLFGAAGLLADPGHPQELVSALLAGDLVGGVLAVWSLRRFGFIPLLERRGDIGLLILSTGLAAMVGAGVSCLARVLGSDMAGPFLLRWLVLGAAGRWIGLLLTALPLLALQRDALRLAFSPARRRASALLLLTLLGITLAGYASPASMRFVPLALTVVPVALLAALVVHAGVGMASAAAAALALGAAWASAAGRGVFVTGIQAPGMGSSWVYAATLVGLVLLVHLLTKDNLSVERRWLLALGGAGLGVGEWRLGRDDGRTSEHWKRLSGDTSGLLSTWLARRPGQPRAA